LSTASVKFQATGGGSNYVAFQPPATIASSVTYTLPSADASVSGYALVSNGSGTLSWSAAGATLSDDTSTTTLYPTMSTTTSGSLTTAKISSTKMTFNAATGVLTTTGGFSASSGNISASSGSITASGSVTASGSGTSGGLRVYTNSGLTASNNYFNIFTSQTSGWSFNANGTGADTNSVFTVSSTGAVVSSSSVSGTNISMTNNQAAATISYVALNNNASGSARMRVGYDTTYYLDIFRLGNAADFYYNATQSTANHYFQTNGSTTWTIGTTGNCTAAGTVTSNSDLKLKTNVETITSALDKVTALRGVMFDRISTGAREMGVIAQEVEAVIPELVFTDENGIKSVAYANTVALLIEAIKEQQKQIDELKGKI
jgi:hypothetical protein